MVSWNSFQKVFRSDQNPVLHQILSMLAKILMLLLCYRAHGCALDVGDS